MRGMRDENAQATVEYVLMLAVALMLFLIIVKGFLKPWMEKLSKFMESKIKDEFFKGGDSHFHSFPFGHK